MKIRPGDRLEVAVWLSGEETEAQLAHFKGNVLPDSLKDIENEHHVIIGQIDFHVKKPGDDRVPQVPDHKHGPDGRLLVAEADVLAPRPAIRRESGFVHDLTKDDLNRLRVITRRAHARENPGDRLSDANCDRVIEALGPDVIYSMLANGKTN